MVAMVSSPRRLLHLAQRIAKLCRPFIVFRANGDVHLLLQHLRLGLGAAAVDLLEEFVEIVQLLEFTRAPVQLAVGGNAVPLDGPTSVTASDNGPGRDVRYLLLDTSGFDLSSGFRVDADVAISEQGDFDAGSPEAWAFDVYVE